MKINQLKAGVILSYLGMGISNLISIIYTPFMLSILGQQEYGLYQMVYSVVSYLGLLSFGFHNSYLRFYSRYRRVKEEDNIARLNGMFLLVFLAMSVAALLGGMVLVNNTSALFAAHTDPAEIRLAANLMKLMVFNLMLTFPGSLFESYVAAHEQYLFQRILNIAQSVLNPMLTLPLLLMGYHSFALIAVQTILTAAKLIVNVWFCRKKLGMRFVFNHMQPGLLKEIAGFSFFIFLNMIVDQINWNVDKFIIGKCRGTIAVAIYSVGAQLNQYFIHFSTAVSQVFLPRVNRMVAEGQKEGELTDLFTRVGRIQFLILAYVLGGFIILGKYFIRVWAGAGYEETYYVTLFLICPVMIPLIQNLGIEIQKAMNKHHFRSLLYAGMAFGNLALSIPLTMRFGAVGAAAGTCISLLLGNGLIMNIYYHKEIRLDMKYFWRQMIPLFPAFFAATTMGLGLNLWIPVNSLGRFAGMAVLYTIIYMIVQWNVGMNGKEKTYAKRLLGRRRQK